MGQRCHPPDGLRVGAWGGLNSHQYGVGSQPRDQLDCFVSILEIADDIQALRRQERPQAFAKQPVIIDNNDSYHSSYVCVNYGRTSKTTRGSFTKLHVVDRTQAALVAHRLRLR
jgi:hypothetical protein